MTGETTLLWSPATVLWGAEGLRALAPALPELSQVQRGLQLNFDQTDLQREPRQAGGETFSWPEKKWERTGDIKGQAELSAWLPLVQKCSCSLGEPGGWFKSIQPHSSHKEKKLRTIKYVLPPTCEWKGFENCKTLSDLRYYNYLHNINNLFLPRDFKSCFLLFSLAKDLVVGD